VFYAKKAATLKKRMASGRAALAAQRVDQRQH
jgi:hypothetical protein